MSKPSLLIPRRSFVGGVSVLGLSAFLFPTLAFGQTAAEAQAAADAVKNQLLGLNVDLEASSENYYAALDEQEAAQRAMQEQQEKIDQANERLGTLQKNLAVRARSMYRTGSSTFLDFALGAVSFSELTQNWDILNKLNENDTGMVDETKTLRASVQAAKDEYERQTKIASNKAATAKRIKDEMQAKVDSAWTLMNTLDSQAKELLEEEQRQAAIAEAQKRQAEIDAKTKQAANQNTDTNHTGQDVPSQGSVVDYALSRIGCPYVPGGEGPDVFDCSGLVTWSYRQIGRRITHQSESQYTEAKQRVSVSEARPGDVLYRFGHVGIAINNGGTHYVHAPNKGLLVRDTDSLSWSGFTHALRF